MGTPGQLTESQMSPGRLPTPDWDSNYGKNFKWGHIPRENYLGTDEDYAKDRASGGAIGLSARVGTEDWDSWEDASSTPAVQKIKNNWPSFWEKMPSYKQEQIWAAIKHKS
jgi:hypothetical protein